ncbi:hypothetical protein GCM10007933_21530 [Zoogloea oryzae]|uniref:Phage tail protein n=1 Tax=Zoogloea oryzae TaxID=310767 RepID=A0ABQ6FAU0_9RHOO|nr:hypothetical protein GCM10007933_21530 [Zoogloea oryzae]
MSLLYGLTIGGNMVPLQVTEAGALVLSGAVSGGTGGTSDTTEVTQLLVKTAVQNVDTDLGAPGDGAAATDVAAVGVIPLIKRSLQRWTTLLAALPANLGAKASAASFPVVLATDQATLAVSATARACVGRQTITIAAGSIVTLTPPGGAVAAHIQADGATVRITLEGTAPSATTGTRIDDGVIYPVDTSLAAVKLFSATACAVQVGYFDKA